MGTKILCWSSYCRNYLRFLSYLVFGLVLCHMHRIDWLDCDALWLFLSEIVENVLQIGELARNAGEKVWRSHGRDFSVQESSSCHFKFYLWCEIRKVDLGKTDDECFKDPNFNTLNYSLFSLRAPFVWFSLGSGRLWTIFYFSTWFQCQQLCIPDFYITVTWNVSQVWLKVVSTSN